jgi:hypothetical protein
MRALRRQTLGLILIAAALFLYILVRYGGVIHWSAR